MTARAAMPDHVEDTSTARALMRSGARIAKAPLRASTNRLPFPKKTGIPDFFAEMRPWKLAPRLGKLIKRKFVGDVSGPNKKQTCAHLAAGSVARVGSKNTPGKDTPAKDAAGAGINPNHMMPQNHNHTKINQAVVTPPIAEISAVFDIDEQEQDQDRETQTTLATSSPSNDFSPVEFQNYHDWIEEQHSGSVCRHELQQMFEESFAPIKPFDENLCPNGVRFLNEPAASCLVPDIIVVQLFAETVGFPVLNSRGLFGYEFDVSEFSGFYKDCDPCKCSTRARVLPPEHASSIGQVIANVVYCGLISHLLTVSTCRSSRDRRVV